MYHGVFQCFGKAVAGTQSRHLGHRAAFGVKESQAGLYGVLVALRDLLAESIIANGCDCAKREVRNSGKHENTWYTYLYAKTGARGADPPRVARASWIIRCGHAPALRHSPGRAGE